MPVKRQMNPKLKCSDYFKEFYVSFMNVSEVWILVGVLGKIYDLQKHLFQVGLEIWSYSYKDFPLAKQG